MSLLFTVDQSRKSPKIVLKVEFEATDLDHGREVDRMAATMVNELAAAVEGQYTLPLAETTANITPADELIPAEQAGPTQDEMDREDASLREAVGAGTVDA